MLPPQNPKGLATLLVLTGVHFRIGLPAGGTRRRDNPTYDGFSLQTMRHVCSERVGLIRAFSLGEPVPDQGVY